MTDSSLVARVEAMIRRLQKKFILLAVLSVFLVLLILIGTINIINYHNMVADADSTLQILAEHRGYFPVQYRTQPEENAQGGGRPFGG